MIEANHLEKSFSVRKHRSGAFGALRSLVERESTQVSAVHDVSFMIEPGEIVGYIGPNGAGKSTTIKMLTGILVPSKGTATVAGFTPWDNRKRLAQRIGVVFGQRTQLWWDLPLIESLQLLKHMYRVPQVRFDANLSTAREILDLDSFLQTPVRQLSLGQRMRGDLAASLLHDPQILYLDEPTIGLDIVAKANIREYLVELNRTRGATILLTTHDLADIEHLCKRIMIIDHGRKVYDGSLHALKEQFGNQRYLTVDFATEPADEIHQLNSGHMRLESVDGPRVRIAFNGGETTAPEVLTAAGAFGQVRDMSIDETNIETIIRDMYSKGRSESAA